MSRTPSFRPLSRRTFVAGTAAASFAMAFPPAVRSGVRDEDRFLGWPIGAQSYSLRNFGVVEAVRHLQGLGLHNVELFGQHLPTDAEGEKLTELLGLFERAEIKVRAHGVASFGGDHEANRPMFEFAKRAGIGILTANPEPNSFDSLEKLVEEYGIRIAIHNHGPGALYDSIDSVVRAVEGKHPSIGACVDTGHFIRSKEDPVEAVERLGKRVFALHVKDEEKQEAESRNVIVGTGFLNLEKLFLALRKVEFPADGSLSLEYEANPDNPVDDMRQCLDMVAEAIAKVGRFG